MTQLEKIKIEGEISKGLCTSSRPKNCQIPDGARAEVFKCKNFSLSIWKSIDGKTVFHSVDWTDGKIHFISRWHTDINESFTSLENLAAEISKKLKGKK